MNEKRVLGSCLCLSALLCQCRRATGIHDVAGWQRHRFEWQRHPERKGDRNRGRHLGHVHDDNQRARLLLQGIRFVSARIASRRSIPASKKSRRQESSSTTTRVSELTLLWPSVN